MNSRTRSRSISHCNVKSVCRSWPCDLLSTANRWGQPLHLWQNVIGPIVLYISPIFTSMTVHRSLVLRRFNRKQHIQLPSSLWSKGSSTWIGSDTNKTLTQLLFVLGTFAPNVDDFWSTRLDVLYQSYRQAVSHGVTLLKTVILICNLKLQMNTGIQNQLKNSLCF